MFFPLSDGLDDRFFRRRRAVITGTLERVKNYT